MVLCKKKDRSWLFGADRNFHLSKSLYGITRQSLMGSLAMPNSDPRDEYFCPYLTAIKYIYNLSPDVLIICLTWLSCQTSAYSRIKFQCKICACAYIYSIYSTKNIDFITTTRASISERVSCLSCQ